MKSPVFPLICCLVYPISAQTPAQVKFEGLSGVLLSNDKIELTILTNGGKMVSLVLQDDAEKVNPMWNPDRMARESGGKPPGPFASRGHFICVDGFGPASPEERAAGYRGMAKRNPCHGKSLSTGKKARHSG